VSGDAYNGGLGQSWGGIVGLFNINTITGVDTGPELNLVSNAIDGTTTASSAAHTLWVYVSETGVTNPLGLTDLSSTLTENSLKAKLSSSLTQHGWSVEETTLYSSTDQLNAGVPLFSYLFSDLGTQQLDTNQSPASAYSVTALYEIALASGATRGTANSTIDISGASLVPEPATWAMLGLGFAGISLVGLTKRRKASRYVAF
jgi:PEP-CTERM motif